MDIQNIQPEVVANRYAKVVEESDSDTIPMMEIYGSKQHMLCAIDAGLPENVTMQDMVRFVLSRVGEEAGEIQGLVFCSEAYIKKCAHDAPRPGEGQLQQEFQAGVPEVRECMVVCGAFPDGGWQASREFTRKDGFQWLTDLNINRSMTGGIPELLMAAIA